MFGLYINLKEKAATSAMLVAVIGTCARVEQVLTLAAVTKILDDWLT